MTQNLVTPEDVVKALGESTRFPEGSPQFQAFAPFVGQLVEIVGVRLNDKVTPHNFCAVVGEFFRWLSQNKDFTCQFSSERAAAYLEMAINAETFASNPHVLVEIGTTEAAFMEYSLGGVTLEAYRKGELTFATLVKSPDLFLPPMD